jgi:hypothetical protein
MTLSHEKRGPYMADNEEIKTLKEIEKMKSSLDKMKPMLEKESVDAITVIVEGESKKRDKHISKTTQPYGAKYGGQVKPKKKKKWGDEFYRPDIEDPRPRPKPPVDEKDVKFKKGGVLSIEEIQSDVYPTITIIKPKKKGKKKGGIVDTTKFRYI